MLASFGSLVLSYVTTASGGAASPGLGGQRTPMGQGQGQGYGHYNLWANAALLGRDLLGKNTLLFVDPKSYFFWSNSYFLCQTKYFFDQTVTFLDQKVTF